MIPYFSFDVIQIGPINIQIWGLFVAVGILLALFLSLSRAKKYAVAENVIYDIFLIALSMSVIGSKIFYIAFSKKPDISFRGLFSDGGFSLFGGLIFSAIAVLVYLKYKKENVLKIADVLVPGLIVALIFTRIGCFLIYDHVGSISDIFWKIAFIDGSWRHPVSLYFVTANIVIFCIIWYLEKRKSSLANGMIFFSFTTLYSVSRFVIDFFRCADLEICDARYFGLTYTQILVLILLPFSVYCLNKSLKIKHKYE